MIPAIDPHKIVVLSGAGISAESGLATFRDAGGMWQQHAWQDVASIDGWRRDPARVLAFYNQRRREAWAAQPNAAHRALARLESAYDVVVVTQNVDALHERAGSSRVIHVHGELAYARGSLPDSPRVRIDDRPIELGECCERGSQLRPDIVWFGEDVRHLDEARRHVATAGTVLVVGTSLSVWPAAGLVHAARDEARKLLVALELDDPPPGFEWIAGRASEAVPGLVEAWLREAWLREAAPSDDSTAGARAKGMR